MHQHSKTKILLSGLFDAIPGWTARETGAFGICDCQCIAPAPFPSGNLDPTVSERGLRKNDTISFGVMQNSRPGWFTIGDMHRRGPAVGVFAGRDGSAQTPRMPVKTSGEERTHHYVGNAALQTHPTRAAAPDQGRSTSLTENICLPVVLRLDTAPAAAKLPRSFLLLLIHRLRHAALLRQWVRHP